MTARNRPEHKSSIKRMSNIFGQKSVKQCYKKGTKNSAQLTLSRVCPSLLRSAKKIKTKHHPLFARFLINPLVMAKIPSLNYADFVRGMPRVKLKFGLATCSYFHRGVENRRGMQTIFDSQNYNSPSITSIHTIQGSVTLWK